ncbi:hypothetical protein C8R46DRAFT_1223816 [Mycena filopes]|nr:hypothetical protein C8R46DRAFT_1223816 [Mycena filopes]
MAFIPTFIFMSTAAFAIGGIFIRTETIPSTRHLTLFFLPLVQLHQPSIRDRLRQNILGLDDKTKVAIEDSFDLAQTRIFQLWADGVSSQPRASFEIITLKSYIAEYSSLFSKSDNSLMRFSCSSYFIRTSTTTW